MYKNNQVRKMAILVAATFFMENLDATVITTAIPDMAKAFQINPQDLSIGISAYMLALAVGLPASGWLANRFTARRIFCFSIILFTLSSICCAISINLTMFTCSRMLQGLAGSLMVPVGRTIVLSRTDKNALVDTISILVWPGLIAPVIGPAVGGLLTQYLSWHWIFLLNLPLGIIGLFFAVKLLPNQKTEKKSFDLIGFVSCSLGLLLFVYGLEMVSRYDKNTYVSLSTIAVGIIMLIFACYHFSHVSKPLISLYAFSKRTFRTSFIGGSLFRMSLSSAPFILSLMFQVAFNWSPVKTGLLLLALFAGNVMMKSLTTRMMRLFGFRNILIVNGILVSISFTSCAFFTTEWSIYGIIAILFFSGAVRSMQFTALNTIGYCEIDKKEMPSANILFTVAQELNNVLGIVLSALFLFISGMINNHSQTTLTLIDFRLTLLIITGLTILALIDFITLPKGIGDQVSGYVQK